jgi:hypothetical protein
MGDTPVAASLEVLICPRKRLPAFVPGAIPGLYQRLGRIAIHKQTAYYARETLHSTTKVDLGQGGQFPAAPQRKLELLFVSCWPGFMLVA